MIKNICLVIYAVFYCYSQANAEVTADQVRSWADPSLSGTQLNDIAKVINDEIVLKIEVTDSTRPMGLSFPGLNDFQAEVLKEIRTRYQESGKRVPTLDVGAGHGLMSWKMIVAGAKAHALELNKPTAQLAVKTFTKAKPFIGEDKLKDISKVTVMDFLTLPTEEGTQGNRREQYDIAWSGSNLHFFNPSQARDYVSKLYAILKPGGRAFLTAGSPCADSDIVDLYLKEKKLGSKFPGYWVTNELDIIGRTYQRADGTIKPLRQRINVLPIKDEKVKLLPGQEYSGAYGKALLDKALQVKLDQSGMEYRTIHIATHGFDHDTLRELFENAGFRMEEVSYLDMAGKPSKIKPEIITRGNRILNHYFVAIRALKPTSIGTKDKETQ